MGHILAIVVIAVLFSTNVVYAQSAVDGEIVGIPDIKFRSGEVKSVVVTLRNTGRDGTHYRILRPFIYSESVRIERGGSAEYSECRNLQVGFSYVSKTMVDTYPSNAEFCEVLKVRPDEIVRIHYKIRAPEVRQTTRIWTLIAAHSCSAQGECKWKEVGSYKADVYLSPATVDSADHRPTSTPIP